MGNTSWLSRLANYVLGLSLLGLAVFAAGTMTFGSPDDVKQALRDSGAYTQAASLLAERASQEAAKVAGSALEDANVDAAAKATITPALVQKDVEGAIDSTYSWLQGDSQQLKLSVDLSPYIDSFTGRLGDQAVQKAEALPDCTIRQLQQLDVSHIDVFNLPCKPTSLDLAVVKQQAMDQLTKAQTGGSGASSLLSNPVVTTDSLPKDAQGRTIADRTKDLPKFFQWSMVLPWICAVGVVVCAGVIMLLNRSTWRSGARRIARTLLGSGITVLVIVLIAKLFFWYATRPDGVVSRLVAGNFSEVILGFSRSLERAYDARLLLFGVLYAVIGIVGIAALRFLRVPGANAGDDTSGSGQVNTDTRKTPETTSGKGPVL